MKKIRELFFELRERFEEVVRNLYNEAEQAIIMEWGICETMMVSQYFPEKGFGFAKSKSGKKYFFHITDDMEYDRRNKKVLSAGQKIFVYRTASDERGLKITSWSENSILENKIGEFKEKFSVDRTIISDMTQEFFFKNLSDEEILDLGPVSFCFNTVISIAGIQIGIDSNAFQIYISGNEETQEIFLTMSHGHSVRKIKISTPGNFKCKNNSEKGVIFSIESLEEYISIKKSVEKTDTYVIGASSSKDDEYFLLKKNDLCRIDNLDWMHTLLIHPETKILAAEAIPAVGRIILSNPLLKEEGYMVDNEFENALSITPCGFENYNGYQLPFFSFSVTNEKERKIMELSSKIFHKYLEDEWTKKYIQKLNEESEEFFIKKKEYIFLGGYKGKYCFLDESPMSIGISEEVEKSNFSFFNANKIQNACQDILAEKKEKFKKNIADFNFAQIERAKKEIEIPRNASNKTEEKIGRFISLSYSVDNTNYGYGVSTGAYLKVHKVVDAVTNGVLYQEISGTEYYGNGKTVTRNWGGGDGWHPRGSYSARVTSGPIKDFQAGEDLNCSFEQVVKAFQEQNEDSLIIKEIIKHFEEKKVFEEKLFSETMISPLALASRFEVETKDHLQIPWSGDLNCYSFGEIRRLTENKLIDLKNFSKDLTLENINEQIKLVQTQAAEIKKETDQGYIRANTLLSETRKFFEKTLSEVEVKLISTDINMVRELLDDAWRFLSQAEFEKAGESCNKAKENISSFFDLAVKNGQENEAERERLGIPKSILSAFGGNISIAIMFISNVSKIETWRLDSHELTCGRNRARVICEEAWSAMGETTDFFCGADPNDVKYYIYEHHFGEEAPTALHREEKGHYNKNLSTSSDAMTEALRKAGLI